MVRPLRIEFAGGLYHITSRGNRKESIYLSDEDRENFLSVLGDACLKYHWLCHSYCLMTNHYHLLIETPLGNLSKGMRYLNGVYTQKFNKLHKRIGHVLQGRYKSILVEKDSYLLELSRYIVLNPVRAGIVEKADEWYWSSYLATSGRVPVPSWLTVDWLLSSFGTIKSAALMKYEQFVYAGLSKKSPWIDLKHQIYLGSDDFISRVVSYVDPKVDYTDISRAHVSDLVKGLPIEEYERMSGNRDEAIYSSYKSGLYSMKEIGKYFGLHYSRISRIIKQHYIQEAKGKI
ncbi:transposase [Legionella anisa]|uniref:Addiction module toxin RelE n=1 Tax=Legionella anisa TaxID=28082 RepID=A0AAX0WN26_9GAMM|nr:transposase [Legionella anisa]AWN73094.1 addiction module toxin RelE [Legionella anisa]KTC67472.1 Transposase IS200 like protein [Legionella anisa]MBN5936480.1 transposase [Legionella anisa]MCW8423923.1 transposase [Legionella anisa]MCW8447445.1 transposase [Legionella anisa]